MDSRALKIAFGILLVPAFFSMGASGDGCGGESQLGGTMGANAASGGSTSSSSPSGTTDNSTTQSQDNSVNDPSQDNSSSHGSQQFGESCGQESACAAGLACTGGTCVTEGNLRFTLVWEAQTDLDIYVKTPNGETIYYRNRYSSDGGVYERDACINTGCDSHQGAFVETVVWESAEPTNGTYEFWAENYNGDAAANIEFDVNYDGAREVFQGSVGGQRDAKSDTFAITVGGGQPNQSTGGGGGDGTTSTSGETYDGDEHDGQGVCGHRWHMPPSVAQAGQHQSVSRDGTGGSCSGGFTPGAKEFGDRMRDKFRHLIDLDAPYTNQGIGGYNCRNVRGSTSLSMHAVGRAVDIHIPLDSSEYNHANNAKGDIIANWLVENAEHIGIQYIIWDRAAWRGYRNSGSNSCYSGDHDHHDHIHVELTEEAANMQTPYF